MLANYLIGLREGLEAALIIGILFAYLAKIERKSENFKLVIGTTLAILASVGVGFSLTLIADEASETAEVLIAGISSILAVVFVTWMIFWMARQSRNLSKHLHSKVDAAVAATGWSLAGVAFFAVIREGVETAIFIWTASRSTGDDTYPAVGATLGLLTASVLGYLIYRGALKLHLGTFFKYTGAFLILVAAGIGAYGIHELQEIHLLPFLTQTSYDVSSVIVEGSFVDTLLRGTIAFRSAPSVLETLVWVSYVVIVGTLFARQYQTKK